MKWRDSYHPYAMTTIFFWSLAYVFTRLTSQVFSPSELGFLRYIIASAALAVVALITRMPLPRRADLGWFAAAGFTGFFLYMIAFNQGMLTLSSATGSVIIATVPMLTALMARFVYGERLAPLQWLAILVEFCGVAVLTLLNGVFSVNGGILLLMAAAVVLAIYNLLQRRLTRTYTALQASTYSIFFGTAMLAVFAPKALQQAAAAPPEQFLYLAVLGIGSSAIAYVCWAKAFEKARQTSQVSNYMFLTPLLTSVIGFVVSGEVPDRATLLGGLVIFAGLGLFHWGKPKAPAE
ncbi:MAG: DMT family transporter [Oscillospiraceae bacterium]|nr:DMT family transporter [Oscillospiraceae bacterium]